MEEVKKKILEEVEAVVKNLPENLSYILAGGYLRDIVAGIPPKDVDLFFENEYDFLHFLLKINNVKTVKLYKKVIKINNGTSYDLIRSRFAPASEIINGFDFTCCQIAVVVQSGKIKDIVHAPAALEHAKKKELHVNKITAPASSIRRAISFVQKGYTIADMHNFTLQVCRAAKSDEDKDDSAYEER